MSNGPTPTPTPVPDFWTQLLHMLESTIIADAGPDIVNLLQLVVQNGLGSLMTPLGQAQLIRALTSLQADAMQAGNDITKQLAALLISYIQSLMTTAKKTKVG